MRIFLCLNRGFALNNEIHNICILPIILFKYTDKNVYLNLKYLKVSKWIIRNNYYYLIKDITFLELNSMENHMKHKEKMPMKGMHMGHHQHIVADFRKRFIVSIILTIPILLLSPLIQNLLKIENSLQFTGDVYVLFVLSSIVFFYGGWPFLKGIYNEIKSKQPGMMTLIALAIVVAYVYSSAIVSGLSGKFSSGNLPH